MSTRIQCPQRGRKCMTLPRVRACLEKHPDGIKPCEMSKELKLGVQTILNALMNCFDVAEDDDGKLMIVNI